MSEMKELPVGWSNTILEVLLDYIQPTKYMFKKENM